MMRPMKFNPALFVTFLFIAAPVSAMPDLTNGHVFMPHRAVYDVELSHARSGSQLSNVSGKMSYEWQPTCEGWISNHSFDLSYDYIDRGAMNVSSHFSTFEPFDGREYQFASKRSESGRVYEEIRGQALLKDGQGGLASYSAPEDLSFDLPAGALFPMQHTLDLIDNIRAGKRFYNAVIFDGSDVEGASEVNTVIGNPVTSLPALENDGADLDEKLLKGRAWNLRMAFFPLSKAQEIAEYEIDLILHENGVVSGIEIEYEDFSVRQNLVKLEHLESLCNDQDTRALDADL